MSTTGRGTPRVPLPAAFVTMLDGWTVERVALPELCDAMFANQRCHCTVEFTDGTPAADVVANLMNHDAICPREA